jgi:flavodoxin
MKIFYFTSTGNSLAVAKKIGGELYSIPKVLNESNPNYTDKEIGIIFPCYINSTPTIVVEFLQKVKLQADYFFAITTYGNFDGGTVHHFDQMAKSV